MEWKEILILAAPSATLQIAIQRYWKYLIHLVPLKELTEGKIAFHYFLISSVWKEREEREL